LEDEYLLICIGSASDRILFYPFDRREVSIEEREAVFARKKYSVVFVLEPTKTRSLLVLCQGNKNHNSNNNDKSNAKSTDKSKDKSNTSK